ncbi:TRAP transporter small permease subunit [Vibrio sp. B1FLJ16]|uniref:TRAP transporter small permease subunit n=1 Tax=Vibrio sp. B1FLJ16 TaxID=2751178 RepID=UPI0015F53B57|nr:TRAP transporter small permease subunit [Vibrio sp. B1FLJ16]CAD7818963.1 COG4665 TRAP-type mannitol chloroaromatic compound transport system [Vibrio sp. B1FLJ16]CAD7819808.1 COG4665 TRAP-type mannitol chloroaromatic compound transport system [Vibrio sp. B1FLJ16]CAE6936792.1 COG4665 TRAP-type mannitol chloroaromatic compound transport system [Vibrio sp. B1FLJ16]CAE6940612.1 COG4665 TRAP-type mannitol chloroaromatic compound transport system [Vibrio sp. B1FLJ16]
MSKVLYSSPTVPLYFQIERLVISASKALAWANLALVVVIITQVVLRKVFSNGQIALEELQWHLYATAVMFGTAYAQVTNLHVRVDLFYHKFSARKKALVDILGILFLAMPFVVVVILHSYDFAYEAWRVNESSASPSGLPYRWMIKSVIPLSFSLLLLSMLAKLLRDLETLTKGDDHGSE